MKRCVQEKGAYMHAHAIWVGHGGCNGAARILPKLLGAGKGQQRLEPCKHSLFFDMFSAAL